MIQSIDNLLNSITMYRLILYGLLGISAMAIALAFLGLLPFTGIQLFISLVAFVLACLLLNILLSKIFKVVINIESALITAVILFLIFPPFTQITDLQTILIISALAMSSKYLLAIKRKHIFNPAAIAAVIVSLLGITQASWWVGSFILLPSVAILGLLVVQKIKRFSMVSTFIIAGLFSILLFGIMNSTNPLTLLTEAFISWPLLFFAFFMLTEPLTTPPKRLHQVFYGAFIGVLFGSQFSFGPIFSSPELALIIGNVFSYLVSPKQKLLLTLQSKRNLSSQIYEFSFKPSEKVNFKPGQYLEWTLNTNQIDSRGNRRFFTIASSPTEEDIKLGIRTYPQGSSFKNSLLSLNVGQSLVASQLAGDFTLLEDPNQKLCFIAGGIGITPFRSMLKYMIDTKQARDIILFYACATIDDFVYEDIFEQAKGLGLKVIKLIAEQKNAPVNWTGKIGFITSEIIQQEVPDFNDRKFYISGPPAMVKNYHSLLNKLGVKNENVITDYFPGF